MGQIVKERREALGIAQDDIDGISSATVRKIERGIAGAIRGQKRAALTTTLRWPLNALDLLADGADPEELGSPSIEISASGVDLDELARIDPEQYESIMDLARIALDRARARRRP